MRIEDLIEDAVTKCGSASALAAQLDVSAQEITRMRQPGAKISLKALGEILTISGLKIESGDKEKQLHAKEQRLKAAMTGLMELYLDKDKV